MKLNNKKIFLIMFAAIALITGLASAHGKPPTQIVTCGSSSTPACSLCELWHLADHIINFLLFALALPILVIAILVGGIVWLFSAGSPQKITLGKTIITSSIIGVLIAFAGWLIVDSVIKTLAEERPVAAWKEIGVCPAPVAPTASGISSDTGANIGTPPLTGIGSVDNANNANALVTSGIAFSGSGSCSNESGQSVSAATNLSELQNKKALTVCRNKCSTSGAFSCTTGGADLDPKVLSNLILAKQGTGLNFTITSLATGDHAANSDHYQGKAVDLVPTSATQANYTALRNQLSILAGAGKRVACEDNGGNIKADCGSGTTHIHASF